MHDCDHEASSSSASLQSNSASHLPSTVNMTPAFSAQHWLSNVWSWFLPVWPQTGSTLRGQKLPATHFLPSQTGHGLWPPKKRQSLSFLEISRHG